MIFDEKTYAENLDIHGFSLNKINRRDLFIYAKWLKASGNKPSIIKDKLVDFCKKHYSGYNEVIHSKYIKEAIAETKKNILRVPINTYITQQELDKINSLPNDKYKKVLFVILVVGKYFGTNPVKILTKKETVKLNELHTETDSDEKAPMKKYFYYNPDIKEAIKIAKISMTKKDRIEMERYFCKNRYLEDMNGFGLKILFSDADGDAVITLSEYGNIVLYYENYIGVKNAIKCDICGILVEKKGKKQKYCEICAIEQNKLKTLDKYHSQKIF